MTESWALFCADTGDELTRGWQGTEAQARALARRTATRVGRPVEFVAESLLLDYEDEAPQGEVVEP
jgi:hypothetical protein